MKRHAYAVKVEWTGNTGTGTSTYRAYSRNHEIRAENKPAILGSSDPKFLGEGSRYNPEEMLVASLSTCHMLWYLHLCTLENIVVLKYRDEALGEMIEESDGAGAFTRVLLRPHVVIGPGSDKLRADALHQEVHHFCFIARSVKFPVDCEAATSVSR